MPVGGVKVPVPVPVPVPHSRSTPQLLPTWHPWRLGGQFFYPEIISPSKSKKPIFSSKTGFFPIPETSSHYHTAIHIHHLTSNITGSGICSQKPNQTGNFLRLTVAAQRNKL